MLFYSKYVKPAGLIKCVCAYGHLFIFPGLGIAVNRRPACFGLVDYKHRPVISACFVLVIILGVALVLSLKAVCYLCFGVAVLVIINIFSSGNKKFIGLSAALECYDCSAEKRIAQHKIAAYRRAAFFICGASKAVKGQLSAS